MDRFYMCFAERGTHPPSVRHHTSQQAKDEAERLARRLGGKVHVLALVGTVEKTDVRWERPSDEEDEEDDIPF